MIPAKKSARFVRWFTGQTEKRIRAMFSKVYVQGEERLRSLLEVGPVLVVSNHTAWWDPMLAIYLGHGRVHADAYALMDAQNLRRLPFLGRIGGFGVDLDDPSDRRRVLGYTVSLLNAPQRMVWIFPEGAERPRAIGVDIFQPGAAVIAARAKRCKVVPVGLRYEFGSSEHPVAYLSIGEALSPRRDIDSARKAQREAVRRELSRIDAFVTKRSEAEDFVLNLHVPPSRTGALAERTLGLFTRYPKGAIQ